jgi:transposase
MLSRWRKQARDGQLRGAVPALDLKAVGELQRLREVERDYKRLKMEHELLKRAIRFARELRGASSRSSRRTGSPSR